MACTNQAEQAWERRRRNAIQRIVGSNFQLSWVNRRLRKRLWNRALKCPRKTIDHGHQPASLARGVPDFHRIYQRICDLPW